MNCGKKRIAAVLAAAALVLSLLPVRARAGESVGAAWQLDGKEAANPAELPQAPEIPAHSLKFF